MGVLEEVERFLMFSWPCMFELFTYRNTIHSWQLLNEIYVEFVNGLASLS